MTPAAMKEGRTERMNTRHWIVIAGAALSLAVATTPAHAINGCGNQLLNGSYAMQFSGARATGAGATAAGPAAVRALSSGLARLSFDAEGSIQGYSTVTTPGAPARRIVTGSYTVNDDCTSVFVLTDTEGNTEHFSGAIVGQGDSMLVLSTNSGSSVSGVLARTRNFCQTTDLAGSFGIQYQGSLAEPSGAQLSSVGLIALDGQGGVSASELRSVGGVYSQVLSSGTIEIAADCSATISLSPVGSAGAAVNFLGILNADGRRLLLLGSDAGTAVSGSIVAQ
jgi:hypothetical protein